MCYQESSNNRHPKKKKIATLHLDHSCTNNNSVCVYLTKIDNTDINIDGYKLANLQQILLNSEGSNK